MCDFGIGSEICFDSIYAKDFESGIIDIDGYKINNGDIITKGFLDDIELML